MAFAGMNPENRRPAHGGYEANIDHFTVDNIENIESNTVNGQAIVKIFLQHGEMFGTPRMQG